MKNIGELVEADRKDNSELLKTLHHYLNNNCNLLKTSESLFIHRNRDRFKFCVNSKN